MNQGIAKETRWGRLQIRSRGDELADRVATVWPGPVETENTSASGIGWNLMDKALTELPAGSWTTYGDLAALIGSHPVPVSMRLATKILPNAHRVLLVDGAIAPGFKWVDPQRRDDPHDLLRDEGVEFDDQGRANISQRLSVEDLAALTGHAPAEGDHGLGDPSPGRDAALRDSFMEQLRTAQTPDTVHGVIQILDGWSAIGGRIEYGTSNETSCFLMAKTGHQQSRDIWPLVLYPAGRVEVVFQHLASRPPFDDIAQRNELRLRLTEVRGIDLPPSKLELRPAFALSVLADTTKRATIAETLEWFYRRVKSASNAA